MLDPSKFHIGLVLVVSEVFVNCTIRFLQSIVSLVNVGSIFSLNEDDTRVLAMVGPGRHSLDSAAVAEAPQKC